MVTIAGMTDRDRQLLALRYVEAEAELAAIAEGRVVDGDPAGQTTHGCRLKSPLRMAI